MSADEEAKKARASCEIKHTIYQPSQEEFCCPKCAAEAGDFCVDESENYECPDIHLSDLLICMKCKHETSGRTFVGRLLKRKNLIPCPHCKGSGVVTGKKS